MLVEGMSEPSVFKLDVWAERVEGKIDGLSDDLRNHEHKSYVTIAYMWGALGTVAILVIGVITDLMLLSLFWWLLKGTYELAHVQTIIFVGLGLNSLFYVFSLRSLRKNIWQYNPFSNKMLVGAVIIGIGALAAAVYIPLLQRLLHTSPLNLFDLTLLIGLAFINVLLIEAAKWYFISRERTLRRKSKINNGQH